MDSLTQSTSTSIAWHNKHVEITPKGLIITGNRYYLNYIPIPTISLDPNHAMFEGWSNAIKLGSKKV